MKAIKRDPKYIEDCGQLGEALEEFGEFSEALLTDQKCGNFWVGDVHRRFPGIEQASIRRGLHGNPENDAAYGAATRGNPARERGYRIYLALAQTGALD
jgi:hypothetical protein